MLEPETKRRAQQRAGELGISLDEYVRRLVARDLGGNRMKADPAIVFDIGASEGSDITRKKSAMIGEAFGAARRRSRSRRVSLSTHPFGSAAEDSTVSETPVRRPSCQRAGL